MSATWQRRKEFGFNRFYCRIWRLASTHQQDSYCHHGRSSGGNCAVHEDDVIFADVFGQTQVMQLARPRAEERGYHGYSRKGIVTTETCYVEERKETIKRKTLFSLFKQNDEGFKGSAATHLWFSWIHVGLDQDLADADVLAHGPQGWLHRLARTQDRHTGDLWRWDEGRSLEDERRESGGNTTVTHPFPVVTAAFVLVTLWRLNYTRLPENTDRNGVCINIRQQNSDDTFQMKTCSPATEGTLKRALSEVALISLSRR